MATVHLKAGGSATSPYDTWAKSLTSASAAASAVAAGDTLVAPSTYSEAVAGVNLTFAGTATSLTKLLSGTEGATSGLTALVTGAVLETTTTAFTLAGYFYAEGWVWRGSAGGSTTMSFAATSGNNQYHKNCKFEITGAGASSVFSFGSGSSSASTTVTLMNPTFKFGGTAQRIQASGMLRIKGGSIDSGGSAVTGLFQMAAAVRGAVLYCDGFDATNAATAVDIIDAVGQSGTYARFRRMKLPASWSGRLINPSNLKLGDRFELIDYSYGTTTFKLWIEDYAGKEKDQTTVKVTANSRAYMVQTTANCSLVAPYRSHEYFVALSGSAQTITIGTCTDNVTLTDDDIYIKVSYLASSTSALETETNDAVASVLATPANQTTSSLTWTTTGLTTPVKQEVSLSVTPGAASYAVVQVVVRRASTTVYLDDTPTVA